MIDPEQIFKVKIFFEKDQVSSIDHLFSYFTEIKIIFVKLLCVFFFTNMRQT